MDQQNRNLEKSGKLGSAGGPSDVAERPIPARNQNQSRSHFTRNAYFDGIAWAAGPFNRAIAFLTSGASEPFGRIFR